MPAYLVSLDGHDDIPIDRVLIVVGRHYLCDARLDSHRVSRRHCCLARDRDGILVRDLGSTNGTRINGHRIEVGLLHPGDELSIAQIHFRLEIRTSDGITPREGDHGPLAPTASAPHDAGGPPDPPPAPGAPRVDAMTLPTD